MAKATVETHGVSIRLACESLAKNVAASHKKSRSFFTRASSSFRRAGSSSSGIPEPTKALSGARFKLTLPATENVWINAQLTGDLIAGHTGMLGLQDGLAFILGTVFSACSHEHSFWVQYAPF